MRPAVSCRRDESKCHQACIFPNPHERRPPAQTFQGPLATPLEPLLASSVWVKTKNIQILKIQIRSAKHVGKVWISRNKNPAGPIWGHLRPFFPRTEQIPKMSKFCLFLPIFPVWGPCCYPPEVGKLVGYLITYASWKACARRSKVSLTLL